MTLPPGLNRAITDSISPFGAYPPAEALRNLEVYFADPRSTDAVYEGLVNRACAEPLSVPLVEKVVALFKAYLLRYIPSQEAVQLLREFIVRLHLLPGLSAAGRKAVTYVASCLRQLSGERASGARQLRGGNSSSLEPGGAGAGRSREDLPRLATNGLRADGRMAAMKVSFSSSVLVIEPGARANDRYAAADALPSPTDADLATAPGQQQKQQLAWLRQSEGAGSSSCCHPLGYEDLTLPNPSQQQQAGAAGRPEPAWAVPSRPPQLPPAPQGITAARARSWLQHLPDLAPRVTLAAPLPDGGGSGWGGGSGGGAPATLSGTPPISLATIHRCVLDLEEADIGRHIAEVLGEVRAEAQAQQVQPATPQRRPRGRAVAHAGAGRDGAGGRRVRPPRLLFHHPPYNRSEPLPMLEADVAVVVEAVCGLRAASAAAAVMGPPAGREGATEAAAVAGAAEGMWQAAFEEEGDFGQICGGILMKLLLDMWLRAEPQDFFIVVLRMLCRALRSAQPATRARAFDVLYNLYVHGAMLRTEAEEAALAAAAAEMNVSGAAGAGGVQMPWQVCASAPVSPFLSASGGGSGQTPPPAPRGAPPATPPASTAEPLTPCAPSTGAGAAASASKQPLASHSLGLQGSALLDTAKDLTGMPLGPGAGETRGGSRPGHPTARKEGGEGVRLPPPSPTTSSGAQTPAPAGGGGGCGSSGGGVKVAGAAAGYDRWLRTLLFRLLYELQQTLEDSEAVWRAALGCLVQLCSHGGYWVATWVQHLPPSALPCLLRAALNFNWSKELYAQLLNLVPCVLLVRPLHPEVAAAAAAATAVEPPVSPGSSRALDSAFAAPAALKSAAAAAGAADAEAAAEAQRRRLADFGGMDELLYHFIRAPTPDSRASLLTVLVQNCLQEPPPGAAAAATAAAAPAVGLGLAGGGGGSAEPLQLLHGMRSPRSSGSPGSRGVLEGGPAGVLAVCQGLHMDSVCLALRAALQRPWQGMSSRMADVLASANLELGSGGGVGLGSVVVGVPLHPQPHSYPQPHHPPHPHLAAALSPSGSFSGSAEYVGAGGGGPASLPTLPAGVASPIAVRALLRPLLESLEAGCADSMTLPQTGELCTHIDVSIAHIAGVGNGVSHGSAADATMAAQQLQPPPPQLQQLQLTAGSVAAAWRAFKDVCNQETWEARGLAVRWLHWLLSAACRACQGQILLLSPLTLKTSPEASKIAAATAPPAPAPPSAGKGAAAAAAQPPRALWNTALADALLHVVREAPLGCELLMKAITRTVADLKSAAGPGPVADNGAIGGGAALSPRLAAAATAAVAAAPPQVAGATAEEAALVSCRRVMWLYHVGLQWMLQCGSTEARTPTVVELADAVLTALLQPDPTTAVAATAAAAAAAAPLPPPLRVGSRATPAPAATGGATAGSQAAPPGPVTAAADAAAVWSQEPGGGMLVSQQLLAGLLALDPDALACTPPELLVTLLQQCSQSLHDRFGGGGSGAACVSNGDGGGGRDSRDFGVGCEAAGAARAGGGEAGFRSMHRGFLGRPCAVVGAASGTGAGTAAVVRRSGGGEEGPAALPPGAAVGPWQDDWQDRRLALLLLLIARCSLDPEAFARYSLSHVIKAQLGCDDLRCRYYAGVYLLKHWMLNQHDKYWRTLRHIIGTAQQLNDERLLDNPYLQMRAMLNVDHA